MTSQEHIPWKVVPSDLGDVPFYIVQFDDRGNCTSPAALDHLVETSKTKTDIFCSHTAGTTTGKPPPVGTTGLCSASPRSATSGGIHRLVHSARCWPGCSGPVQRLSHRGSAA